MKSLQDYTTVIRPEDNGTFVAYVPTITGCHAWGQTLEEARTELLNVFEMIREEYSGRRANVSRGFLKQMGITEAEFNQLR